MRVNYGADVFGSGGKRMGDVHGIVVNAGTKRATYVIVDTGLADRMGHLVGVSAFASSDDRGLHLDEAAARTESQAPVYDSEEVALSQRVEPETTFIPAAGVGGPVMADEPALPGRYPDESSYFEIAPLDPPPVEIESNLEENEVRLDKGTHAYSSDGHKVGDVVGFDLGDMGTVEQVTVSEGFLLKHQSTFPLNEIGEFGTKAVHLRLNREEADKR